MSTRVTTTEFRSALSVLSNYLGSIPESACDEKSDTLVRTYSSREEDTREETVKGLRHRIARLQVELENANTRIGQLESHKEQLTIKLASQYFIIDELKNGGKTAAPREEPAAASREEPAHREPTYAELGGEAGACSQPF